MKEMEKMPKSNLTVDLLFRMNVKERDQYMEKYFNMRYADYLIQSYTRYGAESAAEASIIEGFNARNLQLEKVVDQNLEELGLPIPKPI